MSNKIAPAFRSSMGGFNKKDVTEYISKLNREYGQAIEEKDEEISSLKKNLSDLRAEFDQAASRSDAEAATELEKANNLIAAQTEELEELKKKLASLESELSDANSKLDFYSAKITQYDSMTTRMGEIFMEASADADRIRTEAKASAETLLSRTNAECDAKREATEQHLSEFARVRKEEISKILADTNGEIRDILNSFAAKTSALSKVSPDELAPECTEERSE